MAIWIYIINKPGSDLDQEDTAIEAPTREEADTRAAQRAAAWHCTLRYVGRRVARRYVFDVPREELPAWAAEAVERGEAVAA